LRETKNIISLGTKPPDNSSPAKDRQGESIARKAMNRGKKEHGGQFTSLTLLDENTFWITNAMVCFYSMIKFLQFEDFLFFP
jgi:hypothetical protein